MHIKFNKGCNSVKNGTRVMVFVFCNSSDLPSFLYQVSGKYIISFLSYKAETISTFKTDRGHNSIKGEPYKCYH